MTERTRILRKITINSENKCMRAPLRIPSVADMPVSIPERRATALSKVFEEMPLYIGEHELIVGTRTLYEPHADNTDGHDIRKYYLDQKFLPEYLTDEEKEKFGGTGRTIGHYTPDYGIILEKGVDGILNEAEERKKDPSLKKSNIEFLNSLIIAYRGFSKFIERYEHLASEMAAEACSEEEKARLSGISEVCRQIKGGKPRNFREAIQLLWFATLGTDMESGRFINYGRLDVILDRYLGDTPHDEAQELIECFILKMYDKADIIDGEYFGAYEGQLNVTLGGVLPNGEDAVNDVTMMFLDAIDGTRLPEPEYSLRISSKNDPAFLDRAAELTVSGCNQIAYYNDDRFVEAMNLAGIPIEDARNYGFDLCQDILIPGKSYPYRGYECPTAHVLMWFLKDHHEFETFDELYDGYKKALADNLRGSIEWRNKSLEQMVNYREEKYETYFDNIKKGYPTDWLCAAPTCTIPFLSGMYCGAIENAMDVTFECYPLKDKGLFFSTACEAVNSLAAIKKVVYTDRKYTLSEVYGACAEDYKGEGQEEMRRILFNAPKWANDDSFVDSIAKDLLEFCMTEGSKYRTYTGGRYLTGLHSPHPVCTGWGLMATPDGRHARTPAAVTMSPANGTMRNGPTAAMKSAAIFDTKLLQWNYCFMINYYASVFAGNDGKDIFKTLLTTYFGDGGMQHQPNVVDTDELRDAQLHPEKYKDLIVRMWGVSAHFVDLTKEVQDELIARMDY